MSGTRLLQLMLVGTVAASFLFEFWPLAAASIAAMAFVGGGYLSLAAALFLDLAYGEPTGYAAHVYFPFTAGVAALLTVRYTAGRFFLNRASRDTL